MSNIPIAIMPVISIYAPISISKTGGVEVGEEFLAEEFVVCSRVAHVGKNLCKGFLIVFGNKSAAVVARLFFSV